MGFARRAVSVPRAPNVHDRGRQEDVGLGGYLALSALSLLGTGLLRPGLRPQPDFLNVGGPCTQ